MHPQWLWRTGLALVGGYTYWLATKWAMHRLGERMPGDATGRVSQAYQYTLVAYVTGGVLSITAGLFDPGGKLLILMAGAAASLGGTSALAWGPQLLHDPWKSDQSNSPLLVTRDWRWIIAALVAAILFVFVFGPGVRLHS